MTGSGDGFFASPPPATQAPPPAPPRPSCHKVSQRASSPSPQPSWPARTLCHEPSHHKSRAHVSVGTSPRIICYEPAEIIAQVGMAVNRVAAMPITLREITMGDMAWVTGVAQTARGAVTPHCDAHRPTTTSTHKPHPGLPQGRAGEGLPISSCFCTANGGLFLRPRAAFFTVAAAVVMHGMTVGMAETARRKTRFPTVGTAIHAKAKPTATATAFCIYINLL